MNYLSSYIRDEQSKLFESTGAFFCFSDAQYKEKAIEGVSYCNIGIGLICPTDKVKELMQELNKIGGKGMVQDVADNTAVGVIRREYFNYESQLTMDTTNAMASLYRYMRLFPEIFTKDLIVQTFRQCFRDAVENDWL